MAVNTTDAFVVPNYLETDPETTAARKAYLRSVWNAIAPEIELQYGIYNSTVAGPAALFSQAVIDSIERWREHTQISQLVENVASGEVDYEYLDLFLANYRIKRKTGKQSVGLVRLLFNVDTGYSFSQVDSFTAKGLIFRPTVQVNISPTGHQVYAVNDTTLQKLDNGLFTATIEMESDLVSSEANLTAGTKLVMVNASYPALIDATVVDSFIGGVVEDTLSELVPQLVNGITSKVLSSRTHIASQLKSIEGVNVQDISVIGVGDIESVRDKHGLFPISQGGRGDIYVRTTDILQTKQLIKTCKRKPDTDLFMCWIPREEAIAAYAITSIMRRNGSKNLPIVSETRGVDLGENTYAPDVINYKEGAFSSYQTMLLIFEDVENPDDESEYFISYDYQPYIKELQDYCSNAANMSVFGDLLVKAAVPCKVNISFSVVIQEGKTAPDQAALIAAAVRAVNSTGFMNVLPGASIIEAVQSILPSGMFVSDFMMSGELYQPEMVALDGAIVHLEDGDYIQIDSGQFVRVLEGQVVRLHRTAAAAKEELSFNIPPHVTENTVCFFADSNNVHIKIKTYRSIARQLT